MKHTPGPDKKIKAIKANLALFQKRMAWHMAAINKAEGGES